MCTTTSSGLRSAADKKAGHNLGHMAEGREASLHIRQAWRRAAALQCASRKWPAISLSRPTPYFAETDEAAAYKIKDVPDGSYTVTAWHEGAKNQSKPVTVAGDSKADFTLSK